MSVLLLPGCFCGEMLLGGLPPSDTLGALGSGAQGYIDDRANVSARVGADATDNTCYQAVKVGPTSTGLRLYVQVDQPPKKPPYRRTRQAFSSAAKNLVQFPMERIRVTLNLRGASTGATEESPVHTKRGTDRWHP